MGPEHILLYFPSLQQMQKRGPDLHLAEGLNTEASSEIQWGFFCQMERRLIVLSIKGMLGSLTFTKRLSLPSGRADQGVPACHLPGGVNQMLKMQVKSTCPPPAAVRQAGALSPGPSEEKISLPIFISLFQTFVCRSVQYSLLLQLLSPDFPDYCSQGHLDWDLLSLTLTSTQAPGLETLCPDGIHLQIMVPWPLNCTLSPRLPVPLPLSRFTLTSFLLAPITGQLPNWPPFSDFPSPYSSSQFIFYPATRVSFLK